MSRLVRSSKKNVVSKDAGFTLLELLISVALSMVFISGAITFLISSRSMQGAQESSLMAQENARFVLDELSTSIRMAGYYNLLSAGIKIPAGQFYTGVCGSFDQCTDDAIAANGLPSDRIAVLVNPPQDDGSDGDCGGNPISTSLTVAARSVVAHQYRLQTIDNQSTLVCESYIIDDKNDATQINDTPYLLASGIDALQILYGVTDIKNVNESNNRIARYLSASTINDLPAPTGALSAWGDIASVKLALLASSGTTDKSASSGDQTFQLLDSGVLTIQDWQYRKVYTSTIQINNARH